MRSSRRMAPVIGTLVLSLTIGCKDSTGPDTPRVTPREILKVAGDEQGAVRGTPLPDPLRVRVIGSDGRALAGASVQWAVASGVATVTPTSTTDANGEAEARVTVIGSIGTIETRATVSGVAPVVFSSEGLDPCYFDYSPTLALGTSRPGALSLLDCFVNGWSSDLYVFSVPAQQAISMRVRAASFDPVVVFYPFNGWRITVWDTVNATRDARFKAIVPMGDYGMVASSFDANVTASSEVSVSSASESAEGCELVLVLRGVRSRQELTPGDCGLPSEPYADVFTTALLGGERIVVTQSSADFAPYLQLLHFDGTVMAESDGTASGTAFIDFTARDQLAGYVVRASSTVAGMTGAYELVIDQAIVVGSMSAKQSASAPQRAKRGHSMLSIPAVSGTPSSTSSRPQEE